MFTTAQLLVREDGATTRTRATALGPIGRLGRYTATHVRQVVIAWVLIAVVLGAFAPRVETALSGAGWEATGSQSVASISRDGHTAIVQAGANRSANGMVAAADSLKGRLAALSADGVQVHLTGAAGMWSDFNTANRTAMLKSEVISWPITLGILLLAFGSLVAAGLPLMLTMVGLVSAAGLLVIGTEVLPISIWAMDFALMFALALGIDYALFVVHRFRDALFRERLDPIDATAVTMDTAGKAVVFSGITVLISLTAVMLVPSPAFRSMALGIMLAVFFVLAATLTLLPAVLARLGAKVDVSLPWEKRSPSTEQRSARFAAWGERLWRAPVRYGVVTVAILVGLALPVTQLRTAMPSIDVVPTSDSSYIGYHQVQAAFGPGATGPLQIVVPDAKAADAAATAVRDPGVAAVLPTQRSGGVALITAIPREDPSSPAVGRTIDRLRAELPHGALIGGAVANLLATGAAFGVAKWIFQDGALHSLLGFHSQGFLDAWGPVFFFAMIFAISMDYTVFLLSSAKEHWDRTGDPRQAMIGGLQSSGRVIFAAGAVMVAVFFTFALSGPLPPKEMGVILGVAVLLDAGLIRLLLVPVLLRLMGRRAWYLPAWARRLLPVVTFGHG